MDLRSVLHEIHSALLEVGIDHALIGGLALAAHGSGRLTVGADLLADGERSDDVDRKSTAGLGWAATSDSDGRGPICSRRAQLGLASNPGRVLGDVRHAAGGVGRTPS